MRSVRAYIPAVAAAVLAAASSRAEAAPFGKGPYLQALGPTGVTVKLDLVGADVASVEVTADGDKKAIRVDDKDAKPFHALRVEGLQPATRYAFKATSGSEARTGTFTTAPTDDRKFSFVLYGDSRSDPEAHAAVVAKIEKTSGDFLVNTGDMVADGADEAEWRALFQIERDLLKDRCVFVSVGNHELGREGPAGQSAFLKYFATDADGKDAKKLYGTTRWGNTRFFFLNAMDDWTADQRAWLKAELDKAKDEPGLKHRFAVLHWSPFSSGPHGPNPALARGHVVEMMRDGKVDLVLAGHDHVYERGEGLGVKYVISGGAGAPLYEKKRDAKETRKFESVHHYVEIMIDGDRVATTAKRASGSVLESCGFTANGAWDCDAPASASGPAAGASSGSAPAADPAPTPPTKVPASASACGCEAAGADASGARGLSVALLGASIAWRRRRRRG